MGINETGVQWTFGLHADKFEEQAKQQGYTLAYAEPLQQMHDGLALAELNRLITTEVYYEALEKLRNKLRLASVKNY